MSSKEKLIFVTGGTGFIGSHVINQLLEKGYRVRAAVRNGKKDQLLSTHPQASKDQLEAVEISDISEANFDNAFDGVYGLIHIASPLSFTGNAELILKGAIKGTENVLGQAIKAGIKKIVLTSSWAALFDPDMKKAFQRVKVDDTWWSSIKMEDVTSEDKDYTRAYFISKPLAEQAAWKMCEEAGVDLTTVLPPMVYGPFAPNYPLGTDQSKFSTNSWIYQLIRPAPDGTKTYPRFGLAHYADVRDIAKAHIRALDADPVVNPDGTKRRKRLIVVNGTFSWPEATDYLKEVRPELKDDLEKDDKGPKFITCCEFDYTLLKDVVGMEPENMIPWKQSILETVDSLLEWEKVAKNEHKIDP